MFVRKIFGFCLLSAFYCPANPIVANCDEEQKSRAIYRMEQESIVGKYDLSNGVRD